MNSKNLLTGYESGIKSNWEIYKKFIKKRDKNDIDNEVSFDKKLEVANEIVSLYKPSEPYRLYALTCLSMAEHFLAHKDHDKGREWLIKLDTTLLDNDAFVYKQHDEEMYWSQHRKFLELKAGYFLQIGNSDKFLWICFCLLEQCNNSKQQISAINYLISSEIFKNEEINLENIVDILLKKRGFLNDKIREEYRNALYCRVLRYSHSIDIPSISVTDKNNNDTSTRPNLSRPKYSRKSEQQPIYKPDIERIAVILSKELLTSEYKKMRPSNKSSGLISATDLSSFCFCPASYAIRTTFNLKTPAIANFGKRMHDERLLLFNKKNEVKECFHSFVKTKNHRVLNNINLPQEVKSFIMPLLLDIESSDLIYYGHNNEKNEVFYNENKTICGTPDYVFKRKDGKYFIVEEKFSLQDEISKPYDNHRIQLGTYTMYLEDIKSSYGYVLYWLCHLSRAGFSSYRFPRIHKARIFKLNSSTIFKNEIESVLQQTVEFQNKKMINFKTQDLNTSKCVNCITTEYCNHKTGTIKNLYIPYRKN